ncbi:hypothetical protein DXG01_005507 [Tephrocybe rancida]|nr:hypothetical protein DXG01_005507 [Tephrocybe rancida]
MSKGNHHQFCVKATVRTVEWTLRVRICSKCTKEKIIDIDKSSSRLSTIIGEDMRSDADNEVQTKEFDFLKESLWLMKDKAAALTDDNARDTFLRERREALSDIKTHAALCVTWALAQISDRNSELQQIKDERRNAIIEKLTGLGYETDIASIRQPHSLADHELVKKPQKLTERVWANIREAVLKFMDEMRALRLEHERTELLYNRKSDAVAVFRGYMTAHYPYTDVMPSGLDFCEHLPVKEIIEQPNEMIVDKTSFADVVPLIPNFITRWRQSVDLHMMEVAKSTLPYSDGREWNKYDEFVGDLGDGTLSRPDEVPPSIRHKLATTVYNCSKCTLHHSDVFTSLFGDSYDDSEDGSFIRQPLFYPQVKGHRCLTRVRNHLWWSDMQSSEATDPTRGLGDSPLVLRKQWSAQPLRVNANLGECVKVLVQKAGMDPETTTAYEMDNLGLWFACLKCAIDCGEEQENPEDGHSYQLPAFTWRLAVEHFLVVHGRRTNPAWTKVDSDEIDNAVHAYENHPKSTYNKTSRSAGTSEPTPKDASWSCVECRDTPTEPVDPTSLEGIKAHLVAEHEINQPEENINYYQDFAAVPPSTPQRRKVVVSLVGLEAQQVNLKPKFKLRLVKSRTVGKCHSEEHVAVPDLDF